MIKGRHYGVRQAVKLAPTDVQRLMVALKRDDELTVQTLLKRGLRRELDRLGIPVPSATRTRKHVGERHPVSASV